MATADEVLVKGEIAEEVRLLDDRPASPRDDYAVSCEALEFVTERV